VLLTGRRHESGESLRVHLALRIELAAALALFACSGWTLRAHANGPIGPNGAPITTSKYSLDLFHGPVFAGARVTGLAGSYVAISEDVDGDLQNPASPAVRPFFSYSYFDYWIGVGITFPALLSSADFFNSGNKTHIANALDAFVFVTPALNLQWGELGIGANFEVQKYALSAPANGESTGGIMATIPTVHLQAAHGLFHNQVVLGAGVRFVSLSVSASQQGSSVFSSSGIGVEFGGVYKPEGWPFRLGIAMRTAVQTTPSYRPGLLPNNEGDLVVTDGEGTALYLPQAVAFPWDLNIGCAWQFGARQINPRWRTLDELAELPSLVHRVQELQRERRRDEELAQAKTPEQRHEIARAFEREQEASDKQLERELATAKRQIETALLAMNRFYVQVSASMLISGPVVDGVGVESLVSQTVNRSGQRAVLSPRLGIESGVIPEYVTLRAGTYVEPTRFDGGDMRVHATAGFDVKLIRWNVFGLWPDDYIWRFGLSADVASRYATWGVTLGGWYPRHSATELSEPAKL
jgi:hypothetical protein